MQFAGWHRERGLSGSPDRFGESAAVLLGDLCLVWAEQMLRESGVDAAALARAWPRYDEMRIELAVGQFADLVNDVGGLPDARRGARGGATQVGQLHGAPTAGDRRGDGRLRRSVLDPLGGYGEAIGEAFQLRDDLLGVFGSPTITGKPVGADLTDAQGHQRGRRRPSTGRPDAAPPAVGADEHARRSTMRMSNAGAALIAASGAVQWIEELIADRLTQRASECLDTAGMPEVRRARHCSDMAVGLHPAGGLMRTVGGRTDRVVVVGAGLVRVCRRRCNWPAAAAPSPSSNAATSPAAESGGPTSPATGSTPDRRC